MEELKSASGTLKSGKAVGIDNLHNEMISSLLGTHPEVILKLFNTILSSSEVIPEWVVGLIAPIYKKGLKSDPSNYRGLTLMSCFGKLFLSILNNRLMQYTMENNILHKSQLGFVPGNRTSDAHIINNLRRKYCHKRNPKISSCFVDFAKVFDTIPRDTIPRDTIPRDTIPRDTIPRDTIPRDTIPRDTIPRDTIPRDTIPRDTKETFISHHQR